MEHGSSATSTKHVRKHVSEGHSAISSGERHGSTSTSIVLGSPPLVGQDFGGFLNGLELLGITSLVGVVLTGEVAVGAFNFLVRGIPGNS